MYYIIATLMGVAIVISMVQNARLSQDISTAQTTVLNFMTGLAGVSILFVASGDAGKTFGQLTDVPLFGYIGGILGVTVVYLGTVVIRRLPVITASMLMYTGQMLASIAIDVYRGVALSPYKIFGCVLIIAGIYFNAYVDNQLHQVSDIHSTL